ncbi:MAG: DUF5721 family protein [Eubacteriales bacterium]|nr:DUF5721 family protein [Eubacteriales bacterium]
MLAIEIEHIKVFMNKLLLQNTFDAFLLSEAAITTFTTFSIDGQFHPDFYDDETEESREILDSTGSQVSWKIIRPYCLQLIKGKRLPLSFRFVLEYPKELISQLLEENDLNYAAEDVFGLFLNIQYRNGQLTLTTGSSLRVFSMDHSLDQAWDRAVREFLQLSDLD